MASINIASLTLANSQITDLGNHNTGTCSVTSGSASVTFSTALPVGYRGKRGYQISLSGADYFVDDTASNGLSLTLTQAYAGSTNAALSYTLYTAVELRIYATRPFTPAGTSEVVQSGAPGSPAFYQRVCCSVRSISGVPSLVIPAVTLYSTVDATNPVDRTARYSCHFFRLNGSRIAVYDGFDSFAVPATPTSTTWATIRTYNNPGQRGAPNPSGYTTDQVNNLINGYAVGGAANYLVKIRNGGTGGEASTMRQSGSAIIQEGAFQYQGVLTGNGTPQTLSGSGALGAISLTADLTIVNTSGAASATMAAGSEGQFKTVVTGTFVGNLTLNITNLAGGGSQVVFTAADQCTTFRYLNGKWQPLPAVGTTTGTTSSLVYTTSGITNDGTTDVRAALNTLVNTTMQAAGAGGRLVITSGTFRVGSNLTIPSNVHIDSQSTGILKIDNGIVLTHLGTMPDLPLQYFTNCGPAKGRVDFTGNYRIVTVYGEWFGADASASTSGGYTANYEAFQAAVWAAFGFADRTNGSGNAKYNRSIGLLGNYRIAGTLQFYSVNGGTMWGLNKKDCGFTQMTANTPIINGQSWDYFTVRDATFAAGATQASNPLINIDYTGPSGGFPDDLRPQNITFQDCKFLGQVAGTQGAFMGVWVARNGGGSQGDNIRFLFCYGSWFTHSVVTLGGNNTAPLTSSAYATNALGVQWIGGDIQFCPKYGLASYGGYWNIDGPTTENQCASSVGFPQQTGADFHFEGGSVLSTVANVRSESLRVVEGPANLRNVKQVNATFPTPWFDSNFQSSISGTQAYVNQLCTGSLAAGNGKAYKVTRADSSVSGFIFITGFGGSYTIQDSTASYTPGALVGLNLQVKYQSNGFVQDIGTITGNTATSITYTGGPDTSNFTANSTKYQVIYSTPIWDGLPKTLITSASGTGAGATVTKTSAGWAVNAFQNWRIGIVAGKGITQRGKIASNTSDTITLDSNGWTTDYPYDYLHPDYGIVVPDNTSYIVVEPDWDTQTTSGADIEWTSFDYAAIDGYNPGSTYHTGTIHDVITTVGALVKTSSNDIQSLQVSRADWGSQLNIFNSGLVELYWKDIRVIRERGYVKPLLWVPARNGSTAPLGPTANVITWGSAWHVWNRGLFGGGPALTDLGIGPGDDANANSSTGKDVLAFAGNYWGKRSARGTNQAGTATNIAGGYPTGSGLGGDIGFYTSPTGASGDAVRVGTLRWKIDANTGGLLAGTDGAWSIGANGANRPLDIFTAGKISIGSTGTATATAGAATLSKQRGTITSEALTTAAGSSYTLTLTNTLITTSSQILISFTDGTNTQGLLVQGKVTAGSGSATIVLHNIHASQALNGTILINFLVLN